MPIRHESLRSPDRSVRAFRGTDGGWRVASATHVVQRISPGEPLANLLDSLVAEYGEHEDHED